jgi:hypothetical protein
MIVLCRSLESDIISGMWNLHSTEIEMEMSTDSDVEILQKSINEVRISSGTNMRQVNQNEFLILIDNFICIHF